MPFEHRLGVDHFQQIACFERRGPRACHKRQEKKLRKTETLVFLRKNSWEWVITMQSFAKNQSLLGLRYQKAHAFWFLKNRGKPIRGKIIFRIDQSLYHSSLRAEETTGGDIITRTPMPAFFDSFFNRFNEWFIIASAD